MAYFFAGRQRRPDFAAARLICLDGSVLPGSLERFDVPLEGKELTVGRGERCELRLAARQVSRHHARLFTGDKGWAVEDLDSTNGIFLNGRRLTAGWLQDGDDISFGPVTFRFTLTGASRSAAVDPSANRTALDLRQSMLAVRTTPGLLVLNASPENRAALIKAGLQTGHHVLATSGVAGATQCAGFDPDLIVLDLTGPESGEHDVILRALAAHARDIPVLPVLPSSGSASGIHEAARALRLTLVDPLQPPLNPQATAMAFATLPKAKLPLRHEDLIAARERYQFVVHYQPKVEIASGRVVGAEALVRWAHPERGMIPPDRFIALAERTGEITALTFTVLDQVLEVLAQLAPHRSDFSISINLSVKSLAEEGFADRLIAEVGRAGISPHRIVLEITETLAMSGRGLYLEVLQRFRQHGFGLSLDDFGTGHSSLEELHQMPFTELKIDKHFVLDLLHDRNALAIVQSTTRLARDLGLSVVAEGVETIEVLDELRSMGCTQAQGYLIGRPMPWLELLGWLSPTALGQPSFALASCRPGAAGSPCRPSPAYGVAGRTATALPALPPSDPHKAISDFLAAISHELRTPLNAMVGFSEILEKQMFGPLGNERYRDYARDIRDSGNHLIQIVGNLLDLCEAERQHAAEAAVPVGDLVNACAAAAAGDAARRGVAVNAHVPAGMPGLWADEARLRQILVNLIGNAVRSVPAGGRVAVGARRTVDGGVALFVSTAIDGRQPAPAQEVILPCCDGRSVCPQRSDCPAATAELPLTRALAEAHGATLHLDTEPGIGSTATVTFPAERIGPQSA